MPRLYTRSGDGGETGLLYGGRVSKADPRLEACGAVDEAAAALGLARATVASDRLQTLLLDVQRRLFTVGAELATSLDNHAAMSERFGLVTPYDVAGLEAAIDDLQAGVTMPAAFVVPGGSPGSAALDVGRTVVRRAERRVVGLKDAGLLANDNVLRYLNRLADLVFMMARYEDRDHPTETFQSNRR